MIQLCGREDGHLATVNSLPPQLCDHLAAQLADQCRTPEELPHFQTIPYLIAILYIIPILWDPYSLLAYYVRAARKEGPWSPRSYHGVKEDLRS